MLQRLHLLSPVWKGGAKQGNSGKPFKENPLQARSCVWPVFWLPNSDIRLSPLAWMPKLSKILCCLWSRFVQLTYLPNQEFTQGSKGSAIQPDPLPSRRPESLRKEVLPASPPYLIFYSSALLINSYFHSSCDQDCLRKALLITAKEVFIKVHQNDNSKQLNKHV